MCSYDKLQPPLFALLATAPKSLNGSPFHFGGHFEWHHFRSSAHVNNMQSAAWCKQIVFINDIINTRSIIVALSVHGNAPGQFKCTQGAEFGLVYSFPTSMMCFMTLLRKLNAQKSVDMRWCLSSRFHGWVRKHHCFATLRFFPFRSIMSAVRRLRMICVYNILAHVRIRGRFQK